MNKNLFIFTLIISVSFALSVSECERHKQTAERLSTNESVLLSQVEQYKVNDSLNAAKIGVLTLDLDQYRKYREEDLQTIRDMGIKYDNLKSVSTAQTETIKQFKGSVRDSIVYVDRFIIDTMKCVRNEDKWVFLDICLSDDGTYKGEIKVKDSLIIVSEIKYKRFLGFLWKTNKVKSRKMHIISKNPYTEIEGFEFIEIN